MAVKTFTSFIQSGQLTAARNQIKNSTTLDPRGGGLDAYSVELQRLGGGGVAWFGFSWRMEETGLGTISFELFEQEVITIPGLAANHNTGNAATLITTYDNAVEAPGLSEEDAFDQFLLETTKKPNALEIVGVVDDLITITAPEELVDLEWAGSHPDNTTLVSGDVDVWADRSDNSNDATASGGAQRPAVVTRQGREFIVADASNDRLGLASVINSGSGATSSLLVGVHIVLPSTETSMMTYFCRQSSDEYFLRIKPDGTILTKPAGVAEMELGPAGSVPTDERVSIIVTRTNAGVFGCRVGAVNVMAQEQESTVNISCDTLLGRCDNTARTSSLARGFLFDAGQGSDQLLGLFWWLELP